MFIVNINDDTPVYVQLQSQILDFIALGVFGKDDQLPSVRTLSKQLGINPNTVARAYANLEMQGYVYTKPARGVFVKIENVQDIVYEKKLDELKQKISDCKSVGIQKEVILQMIGEIYKEGKEHVEN